MTFLEFEKDLVKEVESILRDVICKTPGGEETAGVKGYEHQLPVVMEDDEDETHLFPHAIVRLSEASTQDDDAPWDVAANILLGCYDPDSAHTGHRHILVMIQRITDRFAADPLLYGRYRANQDMNWALQDEDTYPYYFGGVQIKFSVPKIERRDLYA